MLEIYSIYKPVYCISYWKYIIFSHEFFIFFHVDLEFLDYW